MKKLLLVAGLLVLAAPPADACGVAVFGSSSSDATPIEPAPAPPAPDRTLTKVVGGLLVASVLARWAAGGLEHVRMVYA